MMRDFTSETRDTVTNSIVNFQTEVSSQNKTYRYILEVRNKYSSEVGVDQVIRYTDQYMNQMCSQSEMGRDGIKGVFLNALLLDYQYSLKIKKSSEELQNLAKTITRLAQIIKPGAPVIMGLGRSGTLVTPSIKKLIFLISASHSGILKDHTSFISREDFDQLVSLLPVPEPQNTVASILYLNLIATPEIFLNILNFKAAQEFNLPVLCTGDISFFSITSEEFVQIMDELLKSLIEFNQGIGPKPDKIDSGIRFIDMLSVLQIVVPNTFPKAGTLLLLLLEKLKKLTLISEIIKGPQWANDGIKADEKTDIGLKYDDPFDFISNIFDVADKKADKLNVAGFSEGFAYISSLIKLVNGDRDSFVSNYLGAAKAATEAWTGFSSFIEKRITNKDAILEQQFDEKFGNVIGGVTAAGSIIGISKSVVDFINTAKDKNSSTGDIVQSLSEMTGSTAKNSWKLIKSTLLSDKQIVKKVVNGKEVTEFSLPEGLKKSVKNVDSGITIVQAGLSTAGSGYKRYEQLINDDGVIDGKDIGEIGVYGSMAGLSSLTKSVTYGLIDIDAEKTAGEMVGKSAVVANGYCGTKIRESKTWIGKVFWSGAGAVEVVKETAVDIAVDTATGVKEKVNTVAEWFKKL